MNLRAEKTSLSSAFWREIGPHFCAAQYRIISGLDIREPWPPGLTAMDRATNAAGANPQPKRHHLVTLAASWKRSVSDSECTDLYVDELVASFSHHSYTLLYIHRYIDIGSSPPFEKRLYIDIFLNSRI